MAEYLKTTKKLADNMALAGKPVDLEYLVDQVLAGLDSHEYNPVVCQVNEKEEISWLELQAILLRYEKRLEQMNAGISSINLGQISTNYVGNKSSGNHNSKNKTQGNFANNGLRNPSQQSPQLNDYTPSYNSGQGRCQTVYGNRGGRARGRRGRSYGSRPTCQVCGKFGHSAVKCYYRFDESYNGTPPEYNRNNNNSSFMYGNAAYVATPGTLNDPRWYVDSGASCHVTDDITHIDKDSEYHGQSNRSCSSSREA